MPKKCKIEGCKYDSRIRGYCASHTYLDPVTIKKKEQALEKLKNKPKKKYTIKKSSTPIKKLGNTRKKEYEQYYNQTLPEFFSNPKNTVCKVCGRSPVDPHHTRGKVGSLLNDLRYLIPLCREHHRKAEENPSWAKENKLSSDRLS